MMTTSAQIEVADSSLPAADGAVRFLELDALRGLAAVAVMISHFNGLWNRHTMSHAQLALFLDLSQYRSLSSHRIIMYRLLIKD